jgi:hypothetical protein
MRSRERARTDGHASNQFVARCERCGQAVREDHSHVMVVPVGRGRMFFHAGCEPTRPTSDQADARVRSEREDSSG